jgi:hypothetical protein
MKAHLKIISVVSFFSVAMAALESAVVVYLRALYYPDGFNVALKLIDEKILGVEVIRELATLVMLLCIGILAGKNFRQRLSYFLLSFAAWDIFYYVWLKVFIDWPSSWFEWDILFLVPITWLGPVLAPVVCSVTMIVVALVLLKFSERRIGNAFWCFLSIGCAFVLFVFMQDYLFLLSQNDLWSCYPNVMSNKKFIALASAYIPVKFGWILFSAGELCFGGALYFVWRQNEVSLG